MKRMEKTRALVVRFSVKTAMQAVADGWSVQPMAKGHAEVWDKNNYCRGFLTTADYKKFKRAKK